MKGVSAGIVAALMLSAAIDAQRRVQPDEVRVPGTGIMLKGGWQLLSYDGCRYAVPLSWQFDIDEAFARAPDGSTISVERLDVQSWSAHKASLRHIYRQGSVLHDDGDRRLWIEFRDGSRVVHHIAALTASNGSTVCTGVVDLAPRSTAQTDDTVSRIADSIGAASSLPLPSR